MKKMLFLTIITLFIINTINAQMKTCNDTELPGWGEDLGTISFVSDKMWTVGSQTWSDAVQAANCNKPTFNGGSAGNFRADCRINPNFGVFFSWYAVVRFAAQLCPAPWRVPTQQDFVNLDVALGGTGSNNQNDTIIRNRYLSDWGAAYGGVCVSGASVWSRGAWGLYWSQSEYDADYGHYLYFDTHDNIFPLGRGIKSLGLLLRCVCDN
ncbi:MAG: fibrobacter succinogenes major paralogous domain-containing protein [Dysgonamonadaceae bacterium]|jgi:uncharacterized protein (TIGR02145 family)|nr:fibrobacter succinogenes major paralogous domain-containing protein [Dysgonamonadaceae bacterium]